MTFDGNRASKQGSALIAANRDLIVSLAGVFFFLPSFALIMLIKQPQVAPGATPESVMAQLQPFLATLLPWAALGSLVQSLGQLALLELFREGDRPTVGQALRQAAGGFPTFFAAQMLIGLVLGALLVVVLALGSAANPIVGLLLAGYVACQAYARVLMVGPAIVAERLRNPFAAIARSFRLTGGQGLRIGHFLLLLGIGFLFAFLAVSIVTGIIGALTLGQGRTAEIVTGFISSAITAAALGGFMAIIAAIYRQLSGKTA